MIEEKKSTFFCRQIALKALSERLSKDHAKPWPKDKSKKHTPTEMLVDVLPEAPMPKTTTSSNVTQVSIDIHSPPSTSST